MSYAVIGLGLNVNHEFAETPLRDSAISLRQVCGRDLSVDAIRDAFLDALRQRYQAFLAGDDPDGEMPFAAWRQRLEPLGRRVQVVREGQPTLVGVAMDVQDQGALLVRDDVGGVHTIWAGDVIW